MARLHETSDAWLIPSDATIHGVGHSNGALLHLLIASMFKVPNVSNIIISFNNKCDPTVYVPGPVCVK